MEILPPERNGYAPSQAAKEYRAKYRYLVIDEYQDSSDVQGFF
ncbi:MAG: UvrD-helicase domain-containing protein [Clostridia bacterium]